MKAVCCIIAMLIATSAHAERVLSESPKVTILKQQKVQFGSSVINTTRTCVDGVTYLVIERSGHTTFRRLDDKCLNKNS